MNAEKENFKWCQYTRQRTTRYLVAGGEETKKKLKNTLKILANIIMSLTSHVKTKPVFAHVNNDWSINIKIRTQNSQPLEYFFLINVF